MNEITVTELAKIDDRVVVDVREQDEWEAGRVPGVIHIPLGQVIERLDEIPVTDRPVYVICGSGGRSARVVEYLESVGVEAVNVAGGTKGWAAEGHPIES